jgi:hypothetical protein
MPIKMLPPPPPTNQALDTRQFRDWFYTIFSQTNGNLDQLGTLAFQNANNVNITGGSLQNVGLSTFSTPGLTGYLKGNGSSLVTASPTVPFSDVSNQPHVEAYDLSATIALTTTPALLKPASTVSGSSGITYSASTGVFTFTNAGSYTLSLSLNLTATAANQVVYVYSDSNTGSGFVPIANSGKFYQLTNGVTTQFITPQAVYRSAGQQIRYWIWCNGTKASLVTQTLPTVTPTVYVPAIRIQYS